MKKFFKLLPLLLLFFVVAKYNDKITDYIINAYIVPRNIYLEEPNSYKLNYTFNYVQQTSDFFANNQKDLLNILYTALNNGYDSFYFMCDYDECESDLSNFIENDMFGINNFIHPFNTYNKLYVTINNVGKVNVVVSKNYTQNDINTVNQIINDIINKKITTKMSDKEKIKTFHDYIINTTKYDTDYIEKNYEDLYNPSHRAIGPLVYHKALCGGYSDTMAIFLNKLNIPNYRIASENHVWNLVYLDNNWYHLDVTWDDPVTSDKSDIILDNFFMISTKQLEKLNTGYHIFDKNIYSETNS